MSYKVFNKLRDYARNGDRKPMPKLTYVLIAPYIIAPIIGLSLGLYQMNNGSGNERSQPAKLEIISENSVRVHDICHRLNSKFT